MYLLFLGMIMLALVALAFVYHQWRQDNPAKAKRVEKAVQRAAKTAATTAASLAHTATKATAQAVAIGLEAMAKPKDPLRWLGPDEQLRVVRVQVNRPLTYVADPRAGRVFEPSAVDPHLPVQALAAHQVDRLPYWPRYDQMTPGQRYLYLQWMAGGRRAMPHEIGYAFVFIYGLERRALLDESNLDLVIAEVLRLRELHAAQTQGFSGSFENYTASFLWFLAVIAPTAFNHDQIRRLMQSARYWNEERLASALTWWALRSEALPDWAAFMVARELPQSQRSVVTDRVGDEFRALFMKRYQEQFEAGIVLKSATRTRKYTYVTASAAIGTCSREAANPLGLSRQLRPLSDIWNQAIDDLRKLSSVVTKGGQDELTAAAWEAMPVELRAGVDHPLTDPFCRLVNDYTDERGRTLMPVSKLAPLIDDEKRDRLTPTQSRRLCQTVEYVGYGLEPDARITGKGYKGDDTVAAFLRVTHEATEPSRYNAAVCMLRLGMTVAAADGQLHPDELSLITQEIEKWFHLNDEEQRRLEAMRSLLEMNGADLTGLGAIIKNLRQNQRQAIGRMLLALAAADGQVTKEEIRAVRKCYKTLGVSEAEVDEALSSLNAKRDDGPVTVRTGAPAEPGELIPPASKGDDVLGLDRAAIAAIMEESREVAVMLADAMNVGQDEDQESAEPLNAAGGTSAASRTATAGPAVATLPEAVIGPTVIETSDKTVPQRYAAFYQLLITKGQWTLEEVQALARQHGVMLGGAVEALNDWSFEAFGGQLFVEDGGTLFVEKALLN